MTAPKGEQPETGTGRGADAAPGQAGGQTKPIRQPEGLQHRDAAGVTPDDDALTEFGLEPDAPAGRILLLACGALAREILAVIRANRWQHLDLACLPAILHNHPGRIPDAVSRAVAKHKAHYTRIFVVYADCGTGGQLFDLCKKLGIDMMEGPHCYSFFEGNEVFHRTSEDEFTAFYLTDFLVRQFDAFVWKPLGLDRHPQLRDMYFGNYTKLVYQAQTENAELDQLARNCARRLGLEFERRFTGYGDLERTLTRIGRAP